MSGIDIDIFNTSTIDAAIKEIEGFKASLEAKVTALVRDTIEFGERAVLDELDWAVYNNYGNPLVQTGGLRNSVRGVLVDAESGYIIADDEAAVYVEYGTGVTGLRDIHHPELPADWQHNSGTKIRPDGTWVYPGNDGNFYVTDGMIHRPFFYQASRQTEVYMEERAEELFG